MTTQTTTTEVPAGTANVPAGSGQASGNGGVADGTGASGTPVPEGGTPGASGAGGDTPPVEGAPPAGDEPGTGEGEAAGKTGDEPTELVLPDGIEVSAEWREELGTLAASIDTLSPLARQQAIVDAGIKFRAEIEAGLASDTNERIAQWAEQAKVDPVIGGAKFDENLMVAQSAFAAYGDPELKTFLVESGLGNHPALLRWAFKVGAASREQTRVNGLSTEVKPTPANSEARMAARMDEAAQKPSGKLNKTPNIIP